MRPGAIAAGLLGSVLAVLLLRLAIAQSDPESGWARRAWPQYPAVLTATAMREVGVAAASGAEPASTTQQRLQQLEREAPLAADPFLVEGALFDKQAAAVKAEILYREALRRQPRSVAGHYLIADLYLRTGRISDGMREMAELARLMPASSIQLVPALAQFARSPGAADQLRQIFRSNPELEQPVLDALAADPSNADLILSVATRRGASSTGAAPEWEEKLLDGIVAQGNYPKAYAIWSRLAGVPAGPPAGLFNPAFNRVAAPAPFNWSFDSTGAGVAEPENGSLRVLFYGRESVTLAGETVLLPPGRYHLKLAVNSASGTSGALAWSVICLPSKTRALDLPLPGTVGSQTLAADFIIAPRGCHAQQVELDGALEDSPQTSDLRISALELRKVGS